MNRVKDDMHKIKVLFADDDSVNLMVIARMLTNGLKKLNFDFECDVTTVEDGDAVIDYTQLTDFDVILLDWEMPNKDGLEVLKELKSNPKTSEIPVIMVTSNVSSEHIRQAFDCGATDYIKKPVEPQELLSRMKSINKISNSYKEIKAKNKFIIEQGDELNAAINYARRLQRSMLPNDILMDTIFKKHFCINIPRDIVSGDFYWAHETDTHRFFALADCTGHGIPAAMITMLGNNLLNESVSSKKLTDPSKILQHVHNGIRTALHQHYNDGREGMDITLLSINKTNNTIEFSSANGIMFIYTGNEVLEFRGDRLSLGGKQLEESRKFTTHSLTSEQQSGTFFFTTDGFIDQFGGPDFKKFLPKRFKEIILNTSNLDDMDELQETFESTITDWIGDFNQMDDILVIGGRLN